MGLTSLPWRERAERELDGSLSESDVLLPFLHADNLRAGSVWTCAISCQRVRERQDSQTQC